MICPLLSDLKYSMKVKKVQELNGFKGFLVTTASPVLHPTGNVAGGLLIENSNVGKWTRNLNGAVPEAASRRPLLLSTTEFKRQKSFMGETDTKNGA